MGAVSPRGRHALQPFFPAPSSGFNSFSGFDNSSSRAASVRSLVQGHTGSVMALAVFEGMQEYVTAGYDR